MIKCDSHLAHQVSLPQSVGAIWQWFCGQVRQGKKVADQIWPQIVDPPS